MPSPASGAQRRALSPGRWHFEHGPMDLLLAAEGEAGAVAEAQERAWRRFQPLLRELVAELPLLKQAVRRDAPNPLRGAVARRMWQACAAMPTAFITPMAAVAGAVAEEVLACFALPGIERAWVNNGGDIALHLAPAASVDIGLVADIARRRPVLDGSLRVDGTDAVRGVATSGWRGRSFSLGVADAVTVLAETAALADAAATVVANAVNVEDARVRRAPADSLKDDSDLGERLVTVDVPPLPPALVQQALEAGLQRARALHARGLIHDAALFCQGQSRLLSASRLALAA